MPITALPTPPSRADAANFAVRADAFFAALPAFVIEFNALVPAAVAGAVTGSFSVSGNSALGSASTNTVAIQAGSAALPALIPSGDANTGLWFPAADTVAVTTGGAERMRIDSDGGFLLGTSTNGTANNNGFTANASGIYSGNLYVNHKNTATNGTGYVVFGYNAGVIGSITQSGTTAVLYNTTSDQRLKTNVVDAPDAAALIDSIRVRSFEWISDQSHQRYGMVAQELAQVAPEAVHAPADPDEMMAVDYSKLVPMLIKEVQSLRLRVAALEAGAG